MKMPQNLSIKLVLSNFILAGLIVPGSLLGQIQASLSDDTDDLNDTKEVLITERDGLQDAISSLRDERDSLQAGAERDSLTLEIHTKTKKIFLLRIDIDKITLEISKIRGTNLREIPGGDPFLSSLGDIDSAIGYLGSFRNRVEGTDAGSELNALSKDYNLFRKTRWAETFGLVEVDRNIQRLNQIRRVIEEKITPGIEQKNINNEELSGLVAEAQAAWQAGMDAIADVTEALSILSEAEGKDNIKTAWQNAQRAIANLWKATKSAGKKTERANNLYNELLASLATCVYPEWSSIEWSDCSVSCGGGAQSRTKVATAGGSSC